MRHFKIQFFSELSSDTAFSQPEPLCDDRDQAHQLAEQTAALPLMGAVKFQITDLKDGTSWCGVPRS